MSRRKGIQLAGSHQGCRNISLKQSFWNKVSKKGEDDCWEWKASVDKDGYGQIWIGSTYKKAHRVSWELHNNPIPKGMLCLHKCDNPSCVNPNHLYIGTGFDNAKDREERNPVPSESRVTQRTFYFGEIWLMRRLVESKKVTIKKVAQMFKCHRETISRYCKRIPGTSNYVRICCKEGYYYEQT